MNHYVYKITNKINNKIYVGVRSCVEDPKNDAYMGSGVAIMRAHKKYGMDNFSKEIIQIFDSREEANEAEASIVTMEFCLREDTYNLKEGGLNGFYTEEVKQKMSENRMGIVSWNKGVNHTQETRDKISNTRLERKIESPFKGRKHTPESIAKLKNKTVSEDVKNKMSESCRNQELYTCIHCGKECAAGNLKRWHNDNCKSK